MRILHILTRYQYGGTERDVAHMARWEQSHGHEVHLAIGPESVQSELPDDVTTHVIPDLVRSISPIRDAKAFRSLRRIISRDRFDVVHTHQSKAGVVGRLAARGRARTIVHTISLPSFGPAYSPPASTIFRLAERYCGGFTDQIVAVGEELVEMYLSAGIGKRDKYSVIRSPIEVTRFLAERDRSEKDHHVARRSLSIDTEKPIALVVAALERRKRVDLVIRALAPEVRRGSFALVVAGEGRERQALEALMRKLDLSAGVRLIGHVDVVPALMSAARVLVSAGAAEGVPQVVIQGLAAGIPIVVTDTIGLREVPGAPISIVDHGGAGLGDAVRRAILGQSPLVPPEALAGWTTEAVDGQIARLYDRIGIQPTGGSDQ